MYTSTSLLYTESGDEWSLRLQHLFITNKAENMSKAYHTVSQSICHRLSFGIPTPFFVVWIKPDVIICGYTYFIKYDDNVFVQIKNFFKCGLPLDSPRFAQIFQFALLFLWGKEHQLRSLRISVALVSCQKSEQFMERIHHVLN